MNTGPSSESVGPKLRHRVIAEAHLVAWDADRVLLTRRANTTYGNGHWHLPSGHLEPGESIATTLIREANEELGITLSEAAIEFVHVMHREDDAGRMGFFFTAGAWEGTPAILEPDKCDGLDWFPVDRLPEPIIDYHHQALQEIRAGRPFSLMGWSAACAEMTLGSTAGPASCSPSPRQGTPLDPGSSTAGHPK